MTDNPGPAPLADQITTTLAEVLLRNPDSWIRSEDGTEVHLCPDPQALMWHEIPFMLAAACEHGETICYKCCTTWAIDYYVRFTDSEGEIFYTPDYPIEPYI